MVQLATGSGYYMDADGNEVMIRTHCYLKPYLIIKRPKTITNTCLANRTSLLSLLSSQRGRTLTCTIIARK